MTAELREQLQQSLGSAYTLERELGGGGMSRTYLAHETALGRKVVVKILSPELAAGVSVERFRREIQLAAGLQHPHIVPVLSSGEAAGLPWFTMPYVEGESLRLHLSRDPMAIGEIVSVLRDVARALSFAHTHGVVHRDIKPDNVLLSQGTATVTDFGIAKALSVSRTGPGAETLTMAGMSIGTPTYMAPEQAAGDPNVDHRSDIYAFGVMAYELLAGTPPFQASSPARMLGAHLGERPRDIRELRVDAPEALAALIMRCLEKDPEARPQQAAHLARVLDSVTSSDAAAAPPWIGHRQMRLGQAVALWAAATVLVALTAWAATDVIGLPGWVFPGSLGVMLAGLPVIVVTWYVQRVARRAYIDTPTFTPGGTPSMPGTMATMALKASPHISWSRTWRGGSIAVGAFALLVIGFMVMRAFGIGPAGSLIGAGMLGARETLMIADFRAPPGDSTLGPTIAEALRTDLGQSRSLDVMTRATVREILRLMQRPVEAPVTFDVAREIAAREGAKAVLDGEITRLGQGYVVSARLVSSMDGVELAKFGQTAASEDALIGAIGKLSRNVRTKIGESLKDIRESKVLERVSTPSLAALRKYVEGTRLSDEVGDTERGLEVLQEAVAIDTAFAMAWRKIAAVVGNLRTDRPRQMDAAARAFRHRERLSETERLLTEAYYHSNGPKPDLNKALAAYQTLLDSDPKNATAANNSAVLFQQKREHEKALQYYRMALDEKRPFGSAYTNIIFVQLRLGQIAGAESTQALFRERLPRHEQLWEGEWMVRWGKRDLTSADSIASAAFRSARGMRQRLRSAEFLSAASNLRGQVRAGLRWTTEGHDAVRRATRAPDRALLIAMDSAHTAAFFLEDAASARRIIRRALTAYPLGRMSPAARPWNQLGMLGADMRDPQLAREALQGFEQDVDQLGLINREGARARMQAWVAMAEARYDDAVREFKVADREYVMFDRRAMVALAHGFDLGGRPDSALTYYERFLTTQGAPALIDGNFRAGAHKRAGELYEAKGDTAKAEFHYAAFIALWTNADPELQPKVRDVRERLARLRRRRG